MLRNTKLVFVTLGISLFAGLLTAGEWDQGPVILGMDGWVGSGSVAIGTGPFSGVTVPESEPNNIFSEADPVGSSDDFTGNISSGAEEDYVSFYAEAGQGMVLETISGGGTLSDTTLTLYDMSGVSELEYDDDGGVGLYSRIDFFFPAAGTYYLAVESYGSGTGTYKLSLRPMGDPQPIGGWLYIWKALDAIAAKVYRPNDGSVVVLGSSDSTATSNDAGAAYHHVVAAAAPNNPALSGVVSFYTGSASIGGFFSELALGNVSPAVIALPGSGTNNSLDSGEGLMLRNNADKIADFIATGGGLIAHGDESNGTVAYGWLPYVFPGTTTGSSSVGAQLSDEGRFYLPALQQADISTAADGFFAGHNMSVYAYAVGVSVPGPGTGITISEQEPNDTSAQADQMEIGDDYTGDIQNAGNDQDRVAFAVAAYQTIIAETVQAGLSDTTLTLYDRNGTTQLAYDDDGAAASLMSRIEYTFITAGTYYMAVDSYSTNMGVFLMTLREELPPANLDVVIGTLPGAWLWRGNALAGSGAAPYLSGSGDLTPDSPFSLDLTRARANSPAFLILGFWEQALPFKGGVMVPNSLMVLPLATNGSGALSISGTLSPSTPADATLFAQYWIQDSAGPEGFTASNGVSLTTQ